MKPHKSKLLMYPALILFVLVTGYAQEKKLVWADEFDYEGLPDPDKWTYDVGDGCPDICGWGNNELEYYTKSRPENARVVDGKLIIEARKENYKGRNYTSARLLTRDKASWKYGRFEIRAKLPSGRGTWPAIWMLPSVDKLNWPEDGEIDIMEHVGFDQGRVHGTIHTEAFNHIKGTQKNGNIMVPDAHQEFHTYAIEWTAEHIKWFIDDKQYFRFDNPGTGNAAWPFDKAFHLILNIAVGGNWGGQEGVDPGIWPQSMEVDFVRVYELE